MVLALHSSLPIMSRSAYRITAASIVAFAFAATLPMHAQTSTQAPTDTTPKITFGAFVDGYFAWDFGRPPSLDRSFAGGTPFTTQPSRHNEFNVNLAYVETRIDAPHYRGRLALQAGTSVQSNYAGEPTKGTISGPSLARMLQEAVVGVKLADNVWVDAGIFYSHVGTESWASRDNPTYSRSLIADYTPYYQSGVKFTWTANAKLTAQLDVVNGWQIISENNSGKGAGLRLDYAADANTTISYFNLVSSEATSRLRVFNGLGVKRAMSKLSVLAEGDVGSQSRGAGASGQSTWYGWTAIARVQATPKMALVARVERYDDKDQVIIATGSYLAGTKTIANPALQAVGGSFGVDVTPYARVAWRTEVRGWGNKNALFSNGRTGTPLKRSTVAVTSLSLTF